MELRQISILGTATMITKRGSYFAENRNLTFVSKDFGYINSNRNRNIISEAQERELVSVIGTDIRNHKHSL